MTTNNFEDILEQHGLNYCKFTMSGMSHEEVKNKYKKHMKKFRSNENKEIKQITDIYFDGSYMCKAKMKEDNTIKDVTFPIIDVKGNILVCLKDLEYMLKGKISLIQDVLQKLGNYTKKEPKKRKPREQKEITIEVANDKESQTQQSEVEALDKLEDLFPDEIYKDLKKHYSMESKNGLETEEVVTTDIDTKQDAEKSHLPLKPNECQNKALNATDDDKTEDKAKDVSAETNVSADQSNEFTVMNEQKMLYMECETAPDSPITNPADKAMKNCKKKRIIGPIALKQLMNNK